VATDATLRLVLLGDDRSASKALGGVGSAAEKSQGKLHSLGRVAAGVFAGGALFEGAQKGIEFLKGSVEAAVQDQQANSILERQLKNTTGATHDQIKAVEDWITKTSEATGAAKSDLTPSLTKLATVTGSVGKAQKLTTLAMNVSAGTHQKLTSVVGAFVKAQNGSVGGLARLGVATKNADGTTKSFTEIQKSMAKQFKGDTAAAADTAAGKMKRLGATWEEMKVQVGDKLIPILTSLAGFMLDKLFPAIGKVSSFLSDKLGPVFTAIGRIVHQVTGGMDGDVSTKMKGIRDTFSSITSIIRSLWKRFGSFILDYIVATLKNVWQIIGGGLKVIQGIFKVFSSLLKGDWKGVWQGIKLILAGVLQVLQGLIKQALNLIKLLWKVGWAALTGILKGVWDGIKSLAVASIHGLIDLIRGIPGDIKKLGGLFLSAGKSLIHSLFTGIVSAAKSGMGFVADLVGAIKNAINSALHLPLEVNFDKGPVHIHATVIPALARGGITTGPMTALIGEAGPEAVIPLSSARGRAMLGGGGGITVIASNLVDPQSTAR
jgi:phage-related protein